MYLFGILLHGRAQTERYMDGFCWTCTALKSNFTESTESRLSARVGVFHRLGAYTALQYLLIRSIIKVDDQTSIIVTKDAPIMSATLVAIIGLVLAHPLIDRIETAGS